MFFPFLSHSLLPERAGKKQWPYSTSVNFIILEEDERGFTPKMARGLFCLLRLDCFVSCKIVSLSLICQAFDASNKFDQPSVLNQLRITLCRIGTQKFSLNLTLSNSNLTKQVFSTRTQILDDSQNREI